MKLYFKAFISVFLLLIISTVSIRGQPSIADLKAEIRNTLGFEKIEKIFQIVDLLLDQNPDQAALYLEDGIALGQELKSPIWEAKFYIKKADLFRAKSQLEKAQKFSAKAIAIFKDLEEIKWIARCWLVEGYIKMQKGEFVLAQEFYQKALVIFETYKDNAGIAQSKYKLAALCMRQSRFKDALPLFEEVMAISQNNNLPELFTKASQNRAFILTKSDRDVEALAIYLDLNQVFKQNKNNFAIGSSYHFIGHLLWSNQLLTEALVYYDKALEYYEIIGNKEYLSSANSDIGEILFEQGKYSESVFYYNKALELKQDAGIKTTGIVLLNLGAVFIELEKFDEAQPLIVDALDIFKNEQSLRNQGCSYHLMGKLNLKTKNYKKAESYLIQAKEIFETFEFTKDLKFVLKDLCELFEAKDDYKEAMKYKHRLEVLKDSIHSIEKIQKINDQLVREKLKIKLQMVDSLEIKVQESQEALFGLKKFKKNTRIQLSILLALLGFGVIGFFSWFRKYRRDIKIRQEQPLELKEDKKVLELELENRNQKINKLSINLVRKNQLLKTLKVNLSNLNLSSSEKIEIDRLLRQIQTNEIQLEDWNYFQDLFEKIFPSYFSNLSNQFPNLTRKDLKFCGLIRSKLSPPEIAEVLGISLESVHSARYRIRKKIGLERKDDLDHFLEKL